MNNNVTQEREITALVEAMDELHITEASIITFDFDKEFHMGNKIIKCVSYPNFIKSNTPIG